MRQLILCFFLISLTACGAKAEKKADVTDPTPLDAAFEAAKQNPEKRADYYQLFLNTEIIVPTTNLPEKTGERIAGENESFSPVILTAEGRQYLMIFDTEARLGNWAKREVGFVAIKGYVLAESVDPKYFWVLNWGTPAMKKFNPDEILWLKEQLRQSRTKAAAPAQAAA